jgi:hypothetical protein
MKKYKYSREQWYKMALNPALMIRKLARMGDVPGELKEALFAKADKPTPLKSNPVERELVETRQTGKPEIPEVPEKLEPLNFDFDEASCVSDRYMFQKAINNIISWANSVTKLLEER